MEEFKNGPGNALEGKGWGRKTRMNGQDTSSNKASKGLREEEWKKTGMKGE